jgi:hypothetical protein
VQQGLQKALVGNSKKLTNMIDEDWEDLNARALSTIHLCIVVQLFFKIVEEKRTTGLWNKLESLYMKNILSNIIFLKRSSYSLRMKEGMKNCRSLECFQYTDLSIN